MKENIGKKMLEYLFNKYDINNTDQEYIISVIKPIYEHKEFIRRSTSEFLHHGNLTLGYHILEDMIVSFKLCRKKNFTDKQTRTVLLIAMMHDLYELPWQNNAAANSRHFFNKHGFRHPIEAAINAVTWFPELFNDDHLSQIIIDGIIHHMFPLPVQSVNYDNYKDLELKNLQSFENLDKKFKDMIIASTNRRKLGCVSFSGTLYDEGKIMRKADKISSLDNFDSLSGVTALVTGKNRSIKKKK